METTHKPLFISYRSTDRPLARQLYDKLTAAGLDVWFDVEALDRVGLWFSLIEAGCEAARIVLPVLTPDWRSEWTEYETYGAEHVVPLVFAGEGEMHECVPVPIAEWQGLDLRAATDDTWQQLFARLRATLDLLPPQQRPRVHQFEDAPAVTTCFVGREATLKELHGQLCHVPVTALAHGPAFVLEGTGGIGKTTLARHYADHYWRLYRDILWISADQPDLLPLRFARVAERLQVAVGDDVDANARRALAELARSDAPRRLLIMDNAHEAQGLQAWLPKTGKCRTIITSRFAGWSKAVHTVHVHVLEPKPAQDLLIQRSEVEDNDANRALADKLAHELGYLPLALDLAAAYIQQHHSSFARYLVQYEEHRQRLLNWRPDGMDGYPDSVATTWQISVEKLGPEALNLLRLLAFVAPDPLPRHVLRQAGDILGDLDEFTVDEALMELHRYSLIELGDGDGPLTIHRLLQAVQEDGLEAGERQGWVEQALRVVVGSFPDPDHANWTGCQLLLAHALVVADHAARHDVFTREAGLLPLRTARLLQLRGQMSASDAPIVRAVATFERLVAGDPTNTDWQGDLSVSQNNLGDLRMAQGDLAGALKAYEAALGIRQHMAEGHPGDTLWERRVSVSHECLGGVRVALGQLTAARGAYEASLAVAQRRLDADPTDTERQGFISITYRLLGDVRNAQGDLAGALGEYEASYAIADRIAADEPGNDVNQNCLAAAHERLGKVRMAQGDLEGALREHQGALSIRRRHADADPGHAEWQRDLSVSHTDLGNVRVAQGDLPGALDAYQAALRIAERLAAADPQNATWQRDLSVSHSKIGDVRVAQGDLTGALQAYQAALTIRERLAAADPQNATWQRDLAVSFYKLAMFHNEAGQQADARARLVECREVLRGMRARSMHLDPQAAGILEQLEGLP